MNASPAFPLTAGDLASLLREVEPAALLVPPRILRRVIKQHRGLSGPGLRVPHRKSYILPRADLLAIATPAELRLAPQASPPDVALLFPTPAPPLLARPPGEVLLRYWRLLFHSRVHLALAAQRAAGKLDGPALRRRVARLGAVAFDEARAVLHQEQFLLPCGHTTHDGGLPLTPRQAEAAGVYEEFAAVYLELSCFDPHRRGQFFPAVLDPAAVDAVLAEDVDAALLFEETRLRGAADPETTPTGRAREPEPPVIADLPDTGSLGALRNRAEAAAGRGNLVRAAILRERAAALSPGTQAGGLRALVRADLEGLAARLQRALHLSDAERQAWARCLLSLVGQAARGVWNCEVRFLVDLQKVCVDHERAIFAVDLVEWLASGFRRPIKRPLPDQPLVLAVQDLRTAQHRLPAVRLPDAMRPLLGELVQSALGGAEARLRETLRPRLADSLDAVGLSPRNAAERLARDKLGEELLDRVVETGHLALGDLRDALARNRLKLPDLRGPVEFLTGDPLLRLNRRLAADLDGVYHRGEVYLRWLQRLSSVFFGNPLGRTVTLFFILPFLGAFLVLKGIDGLSEEGHKYMGLPELHTFNLYSFLGLAFFLLPMLHLGAFRHGVFRALYLLWRGLRGVLYDLPAGFLALPVVQGVLRSRPFQALYQLVLKPALWTAPLSLALALAGAPAPWLGGASAAFLLLVSLLANTRLGMVLEEAAADRAVRTWEMVRNDLLPGLFRWVVWVFRRLRERLEQGMYNVDEWLRFRSGEGRLSFAAKLVLGVVWFAVTYVVRFAVNLLIEPQVNPIKHFPVVTVSHKLMLLLVEPIATRVQALLAWSTKPTTLVLGCLALVPGVFGFLAWELKENWRLYRANQSPTLDPEVVGGHGEKVIQLVRPGFHAGTLPKLYARLRRAGGQAERKGEEGLHHVEEALRRFVARSLAAPLAASKAWSRAPAEPNRASGACGAGVEVGRILLGTNRIRFELACPALGPDPLCLDLANRGGFLLAAVAHPGWLPALTAEQRQAFADVLAGFYKLAGVDLVAEQLTALLPPGADYDLSDGNLTVWLGSHPSPAAVYDLNNPPSPPRRALPPPAGDGTDAAALPGTAGALLFSQRPVRWDAWVAVWERDQAGVALGGQALLSPGPALLPVG
jgi:hypothetical protein